MMKYSIVKCKFEYENNQKKFSYIEKNYNSDKQNFLHDLKEIDSLDYNICINLKHYDDVFKNALVVLDVDETEGVKDYDLMNILKKSNGVIAQTARGYHVYMFVRREFLDNITSKDCYLNVYNKKLKSEIYTIRDTRLIIAPVKQNRRVILYDNNKRYANKNSDKYIRFSKFIEKLHNIDKDEYLQNNETFLTNYVLDENYRFERNTCRYKAKKNIENKKFIEILNKDEKKYKTKFRKSLASLLYKNFFDIDYTIDVLRKKAVVGRRNSIFFKFILHIRALMRLYDEFNIKYDYDNVYNKVMDVAYDVYDVQKEKSDIKTVDYMFKDYTYTTFNDYYEYLRTRYIRHVYESINMNISLFLKRNSRVYKISKAYKRLYLKNRNKNIAFLRLRLENEDLDMILDFLKIENSVLAVILNEDNKYVDIVIKKRNNSRVYKFYHLNVQENYFLEIDRDDTFLIRKGEDLENTTFNEFLFDLYKSILYIDYLYDNKTVSESIFSKKYSEVKKDDIISFIEANKDLDLKIRHDVKSRFMYVYTVCIAKKYKDLAEIVFDIISKYDCRLYVDINRLRFLENVDKKMIDRYTTIY